MTSRFAEGTTVPAEKSRSEIEAIVRKHGASQFSSGYSTFEAGFTFQMGTRRVSFSVARPKGEDKRVAAEVSRRMRNRYGQDRNKVTAEVVAAEDRRLWRCLLLAIKSKMETVASGIATFEEEFLSHIVTDNGMTVMDRIKFAEANGGMKLLPPVTE